MNEVLKIYNDERIVEHVKEVGHYLWDKLEELKSSHDCIVDHRGIGLIQGLEFKYNPEEIVNKAIESGLILIAAGNNTIRFVPPLVIRGKDIEKMFCTLKSIL